MGTIYECKIIRIVRCFEDKNIVNKKGKEIEQRRIEEYDTFISRAENIINQYLNEGWCIINSNYALPIVSTGAGSDTKYEYAEFVFVLQRPKS